MPNDGGKPFERVETLLGRLEKHPDPVVRESARGLVESLLNVHGAALEKMMDSATDELRESWGRDSAVGSVLLLYDLHPAGVEERVLMALDQVRPYLNSHGGNVELVGVADGTVRLKMRGTCKGCPSQAETVKLSIESAIFDYAPEVTSVSVEKEAA